MPIATNKPTPPNVGGSVRDFVPRSVRLMASRGLWGARAQNETHEGARFMKRHPLAHRTLTSTIPSAMAFVCVSRVLRHRVLGGRPQRPRWPAPGEEAFVCRLPPLLFSSRALHRLQ